MVSFLVILCFGVRSVGLSTTLERYIQPVPKILLVPTHMPTSPRVRRARVVRRKQQRHHTVTHLGEPRMLKHLVGLQPVFRRVHEQPVDEVEWCWFSVSRWIGWLVCEAGARDAWGKIWEARFKLDGGHGFEGDFVRVREGVECLSWKCVSVSGLCEYMLLL